MKLKKYLNYYLLLLLEYIFEFWDIKTSRFDIKKCIDKIKNHIIFVIFEKYTRSEIFIINISYL